MPYFRVKRIVCEEFEVLAKDKESARLKIEEPNKITVLKETIKEIKK